MNKGIVIALTALASFAVGCGGGVEELQAEGELASVEQGLERVCVAQSYASAIIRSSGLDYCPGDLSGATTQLSNGHPLNIHSNCGGFTYVIARSIWNGNFYFMRRDALSPC
ncbi:hypothetical protein ACLESO_09990 [Pyxidicoccus sp. 3LG]